MPSVTSRIGGIGGEDDGGGDGSQPENANPQGAVLRLCENNMNFPVPNFTLDHRSVRLNYGPTAADCPGRKHLTLTILSAGLGGISSPFWLRLLRRRGFFGFSDRSMKQRRESRLGGPSFQKG